MAEAQARETPVGLAGPSGHSDNAQLESCATPATLMGFCAPTTTSTRRSTRSGFPTPVCSAFRVSHPLDGLLPPCLPITRIGAARGVHPPERFPPAEPCAFGAVALMPFMTSRSLALRTRRSRCPAAPRRCSLRRSVPACEPESTRADTLMGFSASPECSPDAVRSASRSLPSCTFTVSASEEVEAVGTPGLYRTPKQSVP